MPIWQYDIIYSKTGLGDAMNGAICLICGFVKEAAEDRCKECGNELRPSDRSLALGIARAELTPKEIREVSERIARGERPSAPKYGKWAKGTGMVWREWSLIVIGAIAMTPLFSIAIALRWRGERSTAARQALVLSLSILAAEITLLLSWASAT